MYNPSYFQQQDMDATVQFMQHYSFATVIHHHQGKLHASHLPLMIFKEGEHVYAEGHFSRANPQWQATGEALCIFSGEHEYVSPTWYEHPEVHVPTWNYQAVHAYGVMELLPDPSPSLDRLVAHYEKVWRTDWANPKVLAMQKGIMAFKLPFIRIEAKNKLSQNRSKTDQSRVKAKLHELNPILASFMQSTDD